MSNFNNIPSVVVYFLHPEMWVAALLLAVGVAWWAGREATARVEARLDQLLLRVARIEQALEQGDRCSSRDTAATALPSAAASPPLGVHTIHFMYGLWDDESSAMPELFQSSQPRWPAWAGLVPFPLSQSVRCCGRHHEGLGKAEPGVDHQALDRRGYELTAKRGASAQGRQAQSAGSSFPAI